MILKIHQWNIFKNNFVYIIALGFCAIIII